MAVTEGQKIILGSGKLYVAEFTGTIPADATIEADANLLGKIVGGATVEYKKCLEYIKFVISEAKPHEKIVVVGHHTPSLQSCAEHYRHDTVMNGGYHSSLDEFIMDHPQIVLWTHGHTHENMDYMIGETRVFCNPRGYAGWDKTADTFELKYVEV